MGLLLFIRILQYLGIVGLDQFSKVGRIRVLQAHGLLESAVVDCER